MFFQHLSTIPTFDLQLAGDLKPEGSLGRFGDQD